MALGTHVTQTPALLPWEVSIALGLPDRERSRGERVMRPGMGDTPGRGRAQRRYLNKPGSSENYKLRPEG